MMNREDFDIEKAEALLMAKSWGELSETEIAFLSCEFPNEESYSAMRHQLLNNAQLMGNESATPSPDPAILLRLQNTMDLMPKANPEPPVQKSSIFGGLGALLSNTILGTKAGFAGAALLLGLWCGSNNSLTDFPPSSSGVFADSANQGLHDSSRVKSILFIH